MKKWLSGLIALALTASICVGCAQEKVDTPPSGIFFDITGIDPNSTAYTAGNAVFPTELYLYWIAYTCSSLEYNLNMYHSYYGLYEELFDEEGGLIWDTEFMDGQTLSEYAQQQAEDSVRFYAAIENKAEELGVALTGEDRAALQESFDSTVEQMGGEDEFQENMELMGISRESFDRIAGDARLFEKLLDLVLEEGSAIYLEPEEYEQYASYADHILLGTKNQETGESLSEEEIAQKQSTAQELLDQLQNVDGGELETLFDQLADTYSEDPGRTAEKGYVVTEDTNFVQEFLDAALTLEPGQVSDIVESTYGYHILYRRALPPMLEQSPDQKAALAETYLYELLDDSMEEMTVESSEQAAAINAGEFYTSYNAKVEEITAAKEDNAADSNTDSGNTDGGTDQAGDTGDANDTGDTNDTGNTAGADGAEE